jgi:uncharacterized protein with beta-barrel porin domain
MGAITQNSDGKTTMTSSAESGDRIGLWVSGDAEFTSIDGTSTAQGFDVRTAGITGGVDYKFCSHFVLGAYFDYVNTDASLPGSGSMRANGGKVGGYATLFGGGFYLNAMGGVGTGSFDASRQAVGGLASGSSDSTDSQVHLTLGYDAHISSLTLSPYFSYQYDQSNLHGYTEHGSIAPLQIQNSSAYDERTDLGFKLRYVGHVGHVVITPMVQAAWEHDYASPTDTIYSKLAGGSKTIATQSPYLGSNGAIIGGGVTIDYKNITFFVNDQWHVGRDNYSSNEITGGLRIGF